jgi:hypothetical protein
MVIESPKTRDWLIDRAQGVPGLQSVSARLSMIADQFEHERPKHVVWAVAHGRFLKLLDPGAKKSRLSHDVHVVVISNGAKRLDTYLQLGERVFGPTLTEFNKLTDFEVWTMKDAKEVFQSQPETWKRLLDGVWLYGAPPLDE